MADFVLDREQRHEDTEWDFQRPFSLTAPDHGDKVLALKVPRGPVSRGDTEARLTSSPHHKVLLLNLSRPNRCYRRAVTLEGFCIVCALARFLALDSPEWNEVLLPSWQAGQILLRLPRPRLRAVFNIYSRAPTLCRIFPQHQCEIKSTF